MIVLNEARLGRGQLGVLLLGMGIGICVLGVAAVGPAAILPGQDAKTEKAKPATGDKARSEAELDQLTAPIALYPDSIVSQVLMASTYPMEVIQAHRWVKANKSLKGDALSKALEKQSWDPSVKSLVNFPQILSQMNEKLDWTQKLGDAVLAQQGDVMESVQRLRHKAKEAGHLKTTKEQKVIVEQEIIKIEPVKTEVIYVPTYNPTVVYGTWAYPAYPPYYYYPPSYAYRATAYSFAAGVAVGVAWGYAWGGCHWGHGGHHEIDIDIDRNVDRNRNIDRSKYSGNASNRSSTARSSTARSSTARSSTGSWKHDSSHRKGVRYPDAKTAQQYKGRGTTAGRSSRDAYRGRSSTTQNRSTRSSTRPSTRSSTGSSSRTSSSRSSSGSVFRDYGSKSRTSTNASRGRSSRGRSSGGRSSGGRSRGGGGGRR